jgi:DNA-binding NarL/FixJ family response regulator
MKSDEWGQAIAPPRAMENARGRLRRSDPDEALLLWQGLVDGTWSLVDQHESDGKRYLLARRNAPDVRDPLALTPRERVVLAFAAMGHQNKFIAYLLGLPVSKVAGHLAGARRKLRVTSRAELIRCFTPASDLPHPSKTGIR